MKPTQSLFKRISRQALTTKQANKGYYKGTGSGSMGDHTKHGGYVIDWSKVRTYVVPRDLQSFKLTPFVTKNVEPTRGKFSGWGDSKGPLSGKHYLARWKEENGKD